MTTYDISLKAARRLALRAQLVAGAPAGPSARSALKTIEHLGYVQIDTISVIARAHHHVFWTRQPGYREDFLDRLLARDRLVFEYWTHAASYVPIRDYRYYVPRMNRLRKSERFIAWRKKNRKVVDHVFGRIREEGSLTSSDFEDTRKKRGSWWDWKPAKRALEWLLDIGDLMVTERKNFQRAYDLTERILPNHVVCEEPTPEDQIRFHITSSLRRLGLMRISDLTHKRTADGERIQGGIEGLVADGDVVALRLKGDPDDLPYYALTEAWESSANSRVRDAIHILSPFDGLVIRRNWLERLFDFRYRLECYYPEEKREFGYFTLPLLWKDSLIGRLDAKADRSSRRLLVRNFWFEDYFSGYAEVCTLLKEKLFKFASFNGCDDVVIGRVTPSAASKVFDFSKRGVGSNS